MVICPECGEEFDEDDIEWDCPFCGYEDYGEGFFHCFNCETLFVWSGELWECENCFNEGITPPRSEPVYNGDDDCEDYGEEYCEDGIPDVNQGWVGEHYG